MSHSHQKELRKLLTRCRKAGCTVKPTTAGFQVLPPNGGVVTVHLTSSDTNAIWRILRELRRLGVQLS